jgi:uncharacterized protein
VHERGTTLTLTPRLSTLTHELRARGVAVGVGQLLTAHIALNAIDATSREDVRLALRAILCCRHRDIAAFEAAFLVVFGEGADSPVLPPPPPTPVAPAVMAPAGTLDAAPPTEPSGFAPAAWSAMELLRTKDFAAYTDDERALAQRVLAELARRGPRRPSRRRRAARRRTRRPDVRSMIRASLRYGGEPVERRWHAPTRAKRPLVLVCDVSGSMAPYSRMLLQYLRACGVAHGRVEAFVFGTRLTRVTRELADRDADRGLARAAEAVVDWSGGTRIGEALSVLNREYGRRVGRGADVVLLSDGWDRGDPAVLSAELARLRRTARATIWLNPLKADRDFEPLARGMKAALPHIDHLLAGNSLEALEQLADLLEAGA